MKNKVMWGVLGLAGVSALPAGMAGAASRSVPIDQMKLIEESGSTATLKKVDDAIPKAYRGYRTYSYYRPYVTYRTYRVYRTYRTYLTYRPILPYSGYVTYYGYGGYVWNRSAPNGGNLPVPQDHTGH